MSLVMQGVTVMAQEKNVLSDVSLQCHPEMVLGVVGENGAGKSTFLNALAGLIKPTSGQVRLNGRMINEYSPSELAQARAVLPQNSDLLFPLSAIEVVRLALSLSSYPLTKHTQLLETCLSQFNVLTLAYRNYLTLSGGEKQRVQLARVMAQLLGHQPTDTEQSTAQYLLLDEPISALDLYQQYQTLNGIQQLAAKGMGVVVVLHDLNLASLYCDRVAILKNGHVFAEGLPGVVMTQSNIQHAFNIDVRIQPHPDTQTPFITPRVVHSKR